MKKIFLILALTMAMPLMGKPMDKIYYCTNSATGEMANDHGKSLWVTMISITNSHINRLQKLILKFDSTIDCFKTARDLNQRSTFTSSSPKI